MPVTVAVAAAAVAIGRGGSRCALLMQVLSCDVALRDVDGEMLQLSSSSAVFPAQRTGCRRGSCADLMKPHRGHTMPRSGSAPYIILILNL